MSPREMILRYVDFGSEKELKKFKLYPKFLEMDDLLAAYEGLSAAFLNSKEPNNWHDAFADLNRRAKKLGYGVQP